MTSGFKIVGVATSYFVPFVLFFGRAIFRAPVGSAPRGVLFPKGFRLCNNILVTTSRVSRRRPPAASRLAWPSLRAHTHQSYGHWKICFHCVALSTYERQ